ncbi:type II toxin-antitoxin system RelE/ParE family toxin [Sphingomonas sp. SUN039]|uniref:type II toxin-antitoxin system RelE/ParE family toxin n=1 Tax=Sphingomonas sp. SUN039 TaxID=2937787 RepID=UPI0038D3BA45
MARDALFARAARRDAATIVLWYDGERPGLGDAFRDDLQNVVQRAAEHPAHFPRIRKRRDVRKAALRRFPYFVIFEVFGAAILVVSVFHARRHPRVWRSRLRPR